jgi:VIT1/CCC1 family predicted Fe2+/Mn2+ transporter
VVAAGLAEVAAGSMAMGLGGYLAARSEAEHYMLLPSVQTVLKVSVVLTLAALFLFGYVKG